MPKLDILKELFSNAGIDSKKLVVAYDNGDFIWAARFYWILQTLGHENVGILKVAYGKELIDNFEVSTTDFVAKRSEFVPRIDNSKIETKLSTLLSTGNKTIIDGRQQAHYLGEKSIAKRFGHIPTAKNYACTQNFQVNTTGNKMRELSELFTPFLCFFEKIINAFIMLVWSIKGITAIIPPPLIKLCDKLNENLKPEDAMDIVNGLFKDSTSATASSDFQSSAEQTFKGVTYSGDGSSYNFIYEVQLEDGTIVRNLDAESLQKYIDENKGTNYDFANFSTID